MLWKREKIRLPFRIGTKTFAESAITGINCYQHISKLSPAASTSAPTRELKKFDVSIACYSSCPVEASLPEISLIDRYCRYIVCYFPHYITDVSGSFNDYFKHGFSKNSKKKIKQIRNRWAAHSGADIDWKEYRGDEIEADFLPAARKISCETMQHKLLDRGLVAGGRREAIILQEAQADHSRGYLLFDRNTPVAFSYGVVDESKVLMLEYGGFAPEYRRWSVGTLLDHSVIEHVFSDPDIDVIDFGEGGGEYKKRFSTRQLEAASIIYFQPTLKNIAVMGAYYLVTKTSNGLRYLLLKSNLLEKAKQLAGQSSK